MVLMSMLSEMPGESSCEKGDGENEAEHTKMTMMIIIIKPKSHQTVLTRTCNVMYSTSLYSMVLPCIMVPGLLLLWLTLLRLNSF